ncbi:hypothetical protein [Pseudooceanicola sp.]|uniref:hypothetical protein n=1 Tax=Pseudooceanicola sp. TaxID=1914328 RepID=UPI0040593C03
MIRAPLIIAAALAACTPAGDVTGAAPVATGAPDSARYEGIETRLLDNDLVAFHVKMRGARGAEDVSTYAECAAAQYTLIRGFGFARHLRTKTAEVSGLWQADAIYTISAAIPAGLRTIDAEVTVENCKINGIPTV